MPQADRTSPPPAVDLPSEVAAEIAGYLRSSLFAPLATNVSRLRAECGASMENQKDILQDAQSQISNIIEPIAEELIPIAEELEDVYAQIDLLEALLARTGANIKQMTTKVERTEAAVRRETRALDDGKPLQMWKEYEPTTNMFKASDYVENGRLKGRKHLQSGSPTPCV
ncbi:hypothetical protein EX30DRAFT_21906 [Ascodesmis nigricans]|uniref:Uncharacterized protein n=1 Tax=Ascodesmis nigricans TaxID=341454 RepID=A0A4S2N821_9PEZI|nr:hypothetical protein EX30DRAFT_21906 [Ascodesmis nigricans]